MLLSAHALCCVMQCLARRLCASLFVFVQACFYSLDYIPQVLALPLSCLMHSEQPGPRPAVGASTSSRAIFASRLSVYRDSQLYKLQLPYLILYPFTTFKSPLQFHYSAFHIIRM
jgi:hypothetical protein